MDKQRRSGDARVVEMFPAGFISPIAEPEAKPDVFNPGSEEEDESVDVPEIANSYEQEWLAAGPDHVAILTGFGSVSPARL